MLTGMDESMAVIKTTDNILVRVIPKLLSVFLFHYSVLGMGSRIDFRISL
jgi:hypothetical protein